MVQKLQETHSVTLFSFNQKIGGRSDVELRVSDDEKHARLWFRGQCAASI